MFVGAGVRLVFKDMGVEIWQLYSSITGVCVTSWQQPGALGLVDVPSLDVTC